MSQTDGGRLGDAGRERTTVSVNWGFVGMIAGMALAFAAFFGGFGAFLLVAALGGLGGVVGHWHDTGGRLQDLRDAYGRSGR